LEELGLEVLRLSGLSLSMAGRLASNAAAVLQDSEIQ
jgi:hypothetical protein